MADPNNEDALWWATWALSEQKRFVEAACLAELLLVATREKHNAMQRAAWIAYDQHNYTEAEYWFARAMEKSTDNWADACMIGLARAEQGQLVDDLTVDMFIYSLKSAIDNRAKGADTAEAAAAVAVVLAEQGELEGGRSVLTEYVIEQAEGMNDEFFEKRNWHENMMGALRKHRPALLSASEEVYTTSKDDDESAQELKVRKQLTIPNELQKRHSELIDLILQSESTNKEERQYWINILPVMTPDQVENLRQILQNEKNQLAAIDRKYNLSSLRLSNYDNAVSVASRKDLGELMTNVVEPLTDNRVSDDAAEIAEASLPQRVRDAYPGLAALVASSHLLVDEADRRYWIATVPRMTAQQLFRFHDILKRASAQK